MRAARRKGPAVAAAGLGRLVAVELQQGLRNGFEGGGDELGRRIDEQARGRDERRQQARQLPRTGGRDGARAAFVQHRNRAASAPAATAASTSCSRVRPQILMRVRWCGGMVMAARAHADGGGAAAGCRGRARAGGAFEGDHRMRGNPSSGRDGPGGTWGSQSCAAERFRDGQVARHTAGRGNTAQWAGNVGGAACVRGGPAARPSSPPATCRCPRPTSAPMMLRTMWCQERVGLEVEAPVAPMRAISMLRSCLTGEAAWHCDERKLENRARRSARARRRACARRRARGTSIRTGRSPGPDAAAIRATVGVAAAARGRCGHGSQAVPAGPTATAMSAGRKRLVPPHPGEFVARDRRVEVDDLVQAMHAPRRCGLRRRGRRPTRTRVRRRRPAHARADPGECGRRAGPASRDRHRAR